MDLETIQINSQKRNINKNVIAAKAEVEKDKNNWWNKLCSIVCLKNESYEDKRVGYSHKNRFCIAGICLSIVIIFNVIMTEAGNYTTLP